MFNESFTHFLKISVFCEVITRASYKTLCKAIRETMVDGDATLSHLLTLIRRTLTDRTTQRTSVKF